MKKAFFSNDSVISEAIEYFSGQNSSTPGKTKSGRKELNDNANSGMNLAKNVVRTISAGIGGMIGTTLYKAYMKPYFKDSLEEGIYVGVFASVGVGVGRFTGHLLAEGLELTVNCAVKAYQVFKASAKLFPDVSTRDFLYLVAN